MSLSLSLRLSQFSESSLEEESASHTGDYDLRMFFQSFRLDVLTRVVCVSNMRVLCFLLVCYYMQLLKKGGCYII